VMEWGEGPGVLGVHGWNSRGSRFSHLIKPLLDSGYRFVVFDAPAHGGSSGSHLDLMQYARAVSKIAERTGPFYGLLAHSFGAAASLLAFERGLRVEKIVFLSALNGIQGPIRYLTHRAGMPENLAHSIQACFEKRFKRNLASLEAINLVPRLNLPPSLICHDRHDPILPFCNAQDLARVWKDSRLLMTNGVGHQGILDDPEVVRQVVSFISS